MTVAAVGSGDVFALSTVDGSKFFVDAEGFVTLVTGEYVFPLNVSDAGLASYQIITDVNIAGEFSYETANPPAFRNDAGSGTPDLTDWDIAKLQWVEEDPPTAHISVVGTGWTVSDGMTLTKTAGLGSAIAHVGNNAARRARVRFNCTTGGKVRVSRFEKKNT